MEPLFEKLISTGGPSGVVVLVVWICLKHMREESALNRELHREIHGDNVAARAESNVVIKDNSIALREFTAAMRNGPFQRAT